MPAQPKTTSTEIVKAARHLLKKVGRDGFSMADVADLVGVRAPSLYGHFRNKSELMSAVELHVCSEIKKLWEKAAIANRPEASLMAQAKAARGFAKKDPHSYSLLFDIQSVPTEEGTAARGDVLTPIMVSLAALAGKEHAFGSARVLIPFLHGFISMELANTFRLAGGVDASFENGVATVLRGIRRPGRFDA